MAYAFDFGGIFSANVDMAIWRLPVSAVDSDIAEQRIGSHEFIGNHRVNDDARSGHFFVLAEQCQAFFPRHRTGRIRYWRSPHELPLCFASLCRERLIVVPVRITEHVRVVGGDSVSDLVD